MDFLTFKMTGKSVVDELLKERRNARINRTTKIYIDEYNEYAPDPEIGIWGWEKNET